MPKSIKVEQGHPQEPETDTDEEGLATKFNTNRAQKEFTDDADGGVPPHEIAIAIDLINNKIFGGLTTSELLNFRLVCLQWNFLVTPILQKRVELHFQNNSLVAGPYFTVRVPGRKLAGLSELLRSEPSRAFQFPCTKFHFDSRYFDNKNITLTSFWNENGVNITELSLTSDRAWKEVQHESVLMDQLKNLLLNQTPNLSYLYLNLRPVVEWKKSMRQPPWSTENKSPTLLTSDPEYSEIQEQFKEKILDGSTNPCLNKSLKVLKVGPHPSAKILEVVIRSSQNLEEVNIETDSLSSKIEGVMFFLEPQNRLHLLNKLIADAADISALENILLIQSQTNNLRLRELSIDFSSLESQCANNPDVLWRFISVLNEILQCSCNSLTTLKWNPFNFPRGLSFPKMQNLHSIQIETPTVSENPQEKWFPTDFDFSKVFPNLTRFCLFSYFHDHNYQNEHFVNDFKFAPVLTVKSVYYEGISENNVDSLRHFFPNARFHQGRLFDGK